MKIITGNTEESKKKIKKKKKKNLIKLIKRYVEILKLKTRE